MSRNILETVMGAVVLVVAAIFLVFAYHTGEVRSISGYEVQARFNDIEGIREGGDVKLSGIKVGTILSAQLDPKTFQVLVKMSVDRNIQLPVDTIATITSAGLLGDKHLSLIPGNDDKNIAPGGTIAHTQSPPSLEALLGQAVFSLSNGGGSKDGAKQDGEQPKSN
jgi:phospholipid/cholesterol/gamma-HCH transport system substrate-binding protein